MAQFLFLLNTGIFIKIDLTLLLKLSEIVLSLYIKNNNHLNYYSSFLRIQIITIVFLMIGISVIAQISTKQLPYSFSQKDFEKNIPSFETPSIDISHLLKEDEAEQGKKTPWRFGKEIEVDLNLSNSGTWETLPDGDRIWMLNIVSKGAYSIHLIYQEFFMPEGATLHLYNSSRTSVIGGFTSANNRPSRKFATGLVKGESCILEYFEPKEHLDEGVISISKVIHAYKNIFGQKNKPNKPVKYFEDHQDCYH